MINIYVGNLSSETTENNLKTAFAEHGEVTSVAVIMDHAKGRPRGFGFVEMPNDEEAKKAIEALHLAEMGGRNITVSEARSRGGRSQIDDTRDRRRRW